MVAITVDASEDRVRAQVTGVDMSALCLLWTLAVIFLLAVIGCEPMKL